MIANTNPETGVPYGYISVHALDGDIVTELLDNGVDHDAEDAFAGWLNDEAQAMIDDGEFTEEQHDEAIEEARCYGHKFWDTYQCDEPVVEGQKDGISYCSSWLGGALNFYIFHSPHVTDKAGECSICVPNAGNLDKLDGSYTCYDVPADWRRGED